MPAADPTPAPDTTSPRDPARLAWWLILGATLFRVLYVVIYPLDLAGDEAYYWDWGRRPAMGYFSKPPLIAWLMGLVTAVGGPHTVAIRLASVLLGTGSLVATFLLGRSIFGARAGLWALLFALALPANVLLSQLLTIDAPLVLCWTASLLFFWRWFTDRRPAPSLAGLTLTLGLGYLGKQMMLVFPVLAILFLATVPDRETRRRKLADGRLWAAVGVSLLFLIPPVLWNAEHGWITFSHTKGQVAAEGSGDPFGVSLLVFAASQAGLVASPLIWFLATALAFAGLRGLRQLGDGERFLVIFSAPALVAMYLMALRQDMLPNWPAVYYVAALVLLAGWAAGVAQVPRLPESWRRWARPALGVGFALVAVGYLLPPALDLAGYAGHPKLDPLQRLRGAKLAGREASAFLDRAPNPDRTLVIVMGHRYHSSQLAFYLKGQPRVYRWDLREGLHSQYELWPDPVADGKMGWDALVFLPDRGRTMPYRFQGGFDSLEPLGEVVARVSAHDEVYYRVYLGRNLKKWPRKLDNPGAKAEKSPIPAGSTPEAASPAR
ncbi:MAG: glycosyltransferase family 39 protein [Akkermansiaceae bacterium]|nr:glycosyltransferase family 39 protein [Akkermansiaceae bacterium]